MTPPSKSGIDFEGGVRLSRTKPFCGTPAEHGCRYIQVYVGARTTGLCACTHLTGSAATNEGQTVPFELFDRPRLPLFTSFPTRYGGHLNIIQRIGAKYQVLGIQLLDDDTGSKTEAIIASDPKSPANITIGILSSWLTGGGRQPVTWATFIAVLEEIGLAELAADIKKQGRLQL